MAGFGSRYSFIPNWDNVPVADALRGRFGIPVMVQNNMRVISLAERWFGRGAEHQDYVVVGPRSGFAVAIVQDGKLLDGRRRDGALAVAAWKFEAAMLRHSGRGS